MQQLLVANDIANCPTKSNQNHCQSRGPTAFAALYHEAVSGGITARDRLAEFAAQAAASHPKLAASSSVAEPSCMTVRQSRG